MTNRTTKTVLAGDIGGTKTLLTVAQVAGDAIASDNIDIVAEYRFDSQAYASFDDVLSEFFQQSWRKNAGAIHCACIGVAGPVKGHLAKVTNLPWKLDSEA